MAQSALADERTRQTTANDFKFVKSLPYLFELKIPKSAIEGGGGATSFFYTLPINPQSLSINEPFTVATVPGINGGLVVEENGIVERSLRIAGVTGFRPIPVKQNTLDLNPSVIRSFESRGPFPPSIGDSGLSGQKHLQFLQDRVFRAYADLKRDPRFSRETQLFFHNLKDSEGWEVVPTSFTIDRQAPRSTLYNYEISLIIVGPAKYTDASDSLKDSTYKRVTVKNTAVVPFSFSRRAQVPKDANWFEAVLAEVRKAIAAVNDVLSRITAYANFVRNLVNQVLSLVNEIVAAINGIGEFVEGIFTTATRLVDDIRSTAESVVTLAGNIVGLPDNFRAIMHRLGDSFEKFAGLGRFYNQALENSARNLDSARTAQNSNAATRNSTSSTASASLAISLAALEQSGTTPTLVDIVSALANVGEVDVPQINSVSYHSVGSSDNLPTLAARYLGDSKFWWVIAELNGLRAPYISNIPLPGTIRPGQTLLMPSTASVSQTDTINGIVVNKFATPEVRNFYRDVRLETSTRFSGRLDLVLDPNKGYRDVKYVEGVANLQQGLRTRLETQYGENPFFPELGIPRIIGIRNAEVDTEIVRIMVRRAIENDGRVSAVNSVKVSNASTLDTYVIDADIAARGIGPTVILPTISATVR